MRTNKKCLPILLAVLMMMSLLPCFVSAAGSWTDEGLTATPITSVVPAKGHETELAVFEWYYDYPSDFDQTTRYGLYSPNAYRYDVITLGGVTAFNCSPAAVSDAATKISTLGGQRIHGLEIVDLANKTRRVWINGVEYTTGTTTSSLNLNDDVNLTNVTGTIAYVDPTQKALADFDAGRYAAQLTSSDANVVVGGANLSNNGYALNHTLTLYEEMTVATLKGKLSTSTGANFVVLDADGVAAQDDNTVGQDFAVQVTSANNQVIVKYNITVTDRSWTEVGLTTIDKSNGTAFTPNGGGHASDVAVFEWYFDLPEIDPSAATTYYGLWEGGGNRWQVATSSTGITTFYAQSGANFESTANPKINTLGGQRIHGLQVVDLTGTANQLNRRVWINGVEYPNVSKSWMNPSGSASLKNVTYGTVAYVNATTNPVADFDASRYAAQLASSDANVVVGGEKFGSEFALNHTLTLKKAMTVAELKSALSASTGASIAVLDAAGAEVQDDTVAVTKNFAVKVTSANNQVIVKYNVPTEPGVWTEDAVKDAVKTLTTGLTPNYSSANGGQYFNRGAVFEWSFDFNDEINKDGNWVSGTQTDGVKFYGLYDGSTGIIEVATSNIGITGCNAARSAFKGATPQVETLSGQRIHALEIVDLRNDGTLERRVWINGVEWADCGPSMMKLNGSVGLLGGLTGTYAFFEPDTYAIADFDASGYAAQLTSSDLEKVFIGGANLGSGVALNHTLTLKEEMTVAKLKALLSASNGASIAVLNATGTAAQDTDTVGQNFAVQVTSANEKVIVKYNITDAVPVYTETAEGIEVSVFTSGTSTLYLATYSVDGEVMKLEKLALGVVDEADPTKLVAKLTAADITGKTVKAFHWTNGLQPIAMKVYGAE